MTGTCCSMSQGDPAADFDSSRAGVGMRSFAMVIHDVGSMTSASVDARVASITFTDDLNLPTGP
jgi:hypothetical protein